MTTFHELGLIVPLPPMELRLMQENDERFLEVGMQLARLLFRLGMKSTDDLLDVGCSVGRLPIALMTGTDFRGRYLGFDVMPKQIGWASDHLSPIAPNYEFIHIDVRNDRYNPTGTVAPTRARFPASDCTFDTACLFSIFTHFYASDIRLYLCELHRVLRPGGLIVATWLLYDDDRYDVAVNSPAYPMAYRLDDFTIYNDASHPLRAIAFHEALVHEMAASAGLEIIKVEHGTWAGGAGPEFQDVVLLRRPVESVAFKLELARKRLRRGMRQARRWFG